MMLIRLATAALVFLTACGGSTRTLGDPQPGNVDSKQVQLLLDLQLTFARAPQFNSAISNRVLLTLSGTQADDGTFEAALSAYDFQSAPVLVSGVRNGRSLELPAFTVSLESGVSLSLDAAVVGSGNMATVRGNLMTFQGDVGDFVATSGLLTVSEDSLGSSLVAQSPRGAQQFPFEPLLVLAQEPLSPSALARVLTLKVAGAVVPATLTPPPEVAGRAQRFSLAAATFPPEGAELEVDAAGATDPGGASVVFSSPKAGRVVEAGARLVLGTATESPTLLGWLTSAPNGPFVQDGSLRLNAGTLAAAALRVPDTGTTLRFAVRRGSLDTTDLATPPPEPSGLALLFTAPGVSTAVPVTLDALSTCDAAVAAARCSGWSTQSVDVSALRGKLLYLKLEVPPNQFFAPQRDFYWVKDVRVE